MDVVDYYNLNERDQKAWELVCSGRTKGVFQLDSNLGQSWAKRLQPIDIEEMSDLSALLRPGAMNSMMDDKSMTQHYVDRKFGIELDNPIHPSLFNVLKDTYQILVYQEQSMAIARELAGFTLEQADNLRKAIGKKSVEIMNKCEVEFLEGCRTAGVVDNETASKIFNMIRESQKYQFNKSHSVSYSKVGYWTAYMKANYNKVFLCASMNHLGSLEPKETLRALILEAKSYSVPVYPPSTKSQLNRFSLQGGAIYFGLTAIKDVGESGVLALQKAVNDSGKKIEDFTWPELLPLLSPVSIKTIEPLIGVGYFDFLNIPRIKLLEEYKVHCKFTGSITKQFDLVVANNPEIKSFVEILQRCVGIYDDCVKFEQKKPFNLNIYARLKDIITLLKQSNIERDSVDWICRKERELLGIELTYSKLDKCDAVASNTNCQKIRESGGENLAFAAEIVSVREYTIKDGKNSGQVMAFVTLADQTGYLDCVIFSGLYSTRKNMFYEGNTVFIHGKIGDKGSLIIEGLKEI